VRQKGWRLDGDSLDPAAFEAWAELWHGALAAFDRRLRLVVTREARAVDFIVMSG
jgi:hypothetical protein